MYIRKAAERDIDAVMSIIEEARRTIAALGIDQWQNGSPNRAMIEEDVELGRSFCVVVEGSPEDPSKILCEPREAGAEDTGICGTFALITDGEPVYDRIDHGCWRTPDRDENGAPLYLAIHRVAISVAHRGTGISTAILRYAAEKARLLGRGSLRIDTHEGNRVMRRMLEKHGFVHCGTVYLPDGEIRVAYEMCL